MFVMMDSRLKYFKSIKKMLCWDSRVHQPSWEVCAHVPYNYWNGDWQGSNLGVKYDLKYLFGYG